jgi:hypothetical protein
MEATLAAVTNPINAAKFKTAHGIALDVQSIQSGSSLIDY